MDFGLEDLFFKRIVRTESSEKYLVFFINPELTKELQQSVQGFESEKLKKDILDVQLKENEIIKEENIVMIFDIHYLGNNKIDISSMVVGIDRFEEPFKLQKDIYMYLSDMLFTDEKINMHLLSGEYLALMNDNSNDEK